MRKCLVIIVLLLCWSLPASAQDDPSVPQEAKALLKSFRSDQVLRVDFEEEVQLPFLKHPLKSKGRLIVHPDGHFIRQITSPTPSTAVLSENSITMRDSTGTTKIDKATAPEVASALVLLSSLVSADVEALQSKYDVSVDTSESDESWTVTLESRASKALFERCEVKGRAEKVTQIILHETDDVVRTMTFASPTRTPKLTDEERATLKSMTGSSD